MSFLASVQRNLRSKTPEIIIGSLSLIAGLAWNNAFSTLINHYFPVGASSGSYLFKFLYAIVITIIFVAVITLIVGDNKV